MIVISGRMIRRSLQTVISTVTGSPTCTAGGAKRSNRRPRTASQACTADAASVAMIAITM